jgi:serine carboxypeptidase-like clade 2
MILILLVAICVLAVPGDVFRINSMPGLKRMPAYGMYSGYIQVDASSNRNLFFAFAEAKTKNRATAPVVLWLTGGPGCSSMLAFFGENGPFQVEQHMNLEANVYSWNQEANVIWLESPAGVGFSYSNNTMDYTTGDKRTAADTYTFLQSFFTYFPQYVSNELWITGESYGGHYVPEISTLVYKNNALGMRKINIVGMMVGNAWTQVSATVSSAVKCHGCYCRLTLIMLVHCIRGHNAH